MGIPYFYIIKHQLSGKYYAGYKINSSADSSNLLTLNGYKTTSKGEKNPMFNRKHNDLTKAKMKLIWQKRREKNI